MTDTGAGMAWYTKPRRACGHFTGHPNTFNPAFRRKPESNLRGATIPRPNRLATPQPSGLDRASALGDGYILPAGISHSKISRKLPKISTK